MEPKSSAVYYQARLDWHPSKVMKAGVKSTRYTVTSRPTWATSDLVSENPKQNKTFIIFTLRRLHRVNQLIPGFPLGGEHFPQYLTILTKDRQRLTFWLLSAGAGMLLPSC